MLEGYLDSYREAPRAFLKAQRRAQRAREDARFRAGSRRSGSGSDRGSQPGLEDPLGDLFATGGPGSRAAERKGAERDGFRLLEVLQRLLQGGARLPKAVVAEVVQMVEDGDIHASPRLALEAFKVLQLCALAAPPVALVDGAGPSAKPLLREDPAAWTVHHGPYDGPERFDFRDPAVFGGTSRRFLHGLKESDKRLVDCPRRLQWVWLCSLLRHALDAFDPARRRQDVPGSNAKTSSAAAAAAQRRRRHRGGLLLLKHSVGQLLDDLACRMPVFRQHGDERALTGSMLWELYHRDHGTGKGEELRELCADEPVWPHRTFLLALARLMALPACADAEDDAEVGEEEEVAAGEMPVQEGAAVAGLLLGLLLDLYSALEEFGYWEPSGRYADANPVNCRVELDGWLHDAWLRMPGPEERQAFLRHLWGPQHLVRFVTQLFAAQLGPQHPLAGKKFPGLRARAGNVHRFKFVPVPLGEVLHAFAEDPKASATVLGGSDAVALLACAGSRAWLEDMTLDPALSLQLAHRWLAALQEALEDLAATSTAKAKHALAPATSAALAVAVGVLAARAG